MVVLMNPPDKKFFSGSRSELSQLNAPALEARPSGIVTYVSLEERYVWSLFLCFR